MRNILHFVLLCLAVKAFALHGWNFAVTEILPSFSGEPDSSYVSAISTPGPKATEDLIESYDPDGNILWGVPPTLPRTATVTEKKSVDLTYGDAGSHETNVLKPEFRIVNTGSVALRNYRIRGYVSAPAGCSFNTPIDDWYTPESAPSLTKIADNVWMFEIAFDEHILYPGQDVFSGNIGIHLTGWENFDKRLLGLVVVDENGEILWGTPWNGTDDSVKAEYANAQN